MVNFASQVNGEWDIDNKFTSEADLDCEWSIFAAQVNGQ